MKRREFVRNTALIGTAATLVPNWLTAVEKPVNEILNTDNDNIMIIVELFGGNDGLNTIIPFAQEELYYQLRPNLKILPEFAVRFADSDLYFNSGLVDGVHNGGFLNLMDTGKLAVIQGIGYDNPNLSHFRSRDIWHSGINSSDPNEKLLEGWLGRFLASRLTDYPEVIPEHPIAISLEGTVPLLMKSAKGDMGISLQNPEEFYNLGEGLMPKTLKFHIPESTFYEREFNFIHTVGEQSEKYAQRVKEAYEKGKDLVKVDYSSGLPQKFRVISALIAGGLQTKVYYLNLSNFDSHAQQMQADYRGAHYTLLNALSRGICEFLDDAQQQGFADRVAGLTTSEFGRRANDNGSRGTDHGAASVQFVFAGSDSYVEGGYFRVEGTPDLSNLDNLENITHQYDFRRTYNDFLETWLGATPEETHDIFHDAFLPLGVLNKRETSVNEYINNKNFTNLLVYPNPTSGVINVRFDLNQYSHIKIELYSTLGQRLLTLEDGFFNRGFYDKQFFINTIGQYNLVVSIGKSRIIKKLMVIK